MNVKIVADSSANLLAFEGVPFASVPLKIVTAEREFVDDPALDTGEMLTYIEGYQGKSGTACPSVGEWLVDGYEDYGTRYGKYVWLDARNRAYGG